MVPRKFLAIASEWCFSQYRKAFLKGAWCSFWTAGRKCEGVSHRAAEGHRMEGSEVMGSLLASFSATSPHLDERSVYLGMFSLPLAEKQSHKYYSPHKGLQCLCLFSSIRIDEQFLWKSTLNFEPVFPVRAHAHYICFSPLVWDFI